MKKKLVFVFLVLFMIVGCGKSKDGSYGFNEAFQYDGFEITIGEDYKFETIDNKYSEFYGKERVLLPVKVKNETDSSKKLDTSVIQIYGAKGEVVDSFFIGTEDDLVSSKELKNGEAYTKNYYFLYDGNGEYILKFSDNISVKIEIKK